MNRTHLSRDQVEGLEFVEYYSIIRKWNFRLVSICLFIISVMMGSFVISVSTFDGICHFILAILSWLPFAITFFPRFLRYMDTYFVLQLSAFFGLHVLFLLSGNSTVATGFPFIPLTLTLLPVLKLRPGFAAIAAAQGVLPMIASSMAIKYTDQFDAFTVALNFIFLIQLAVITIPGCQMMRNLEFSRYKSLIQMHRAKLLLERQKLQNSKLLETLFPPMIREFVEKHEASNYQAATIIFADLENFADLTAAMEPSESIALLNKVFVLFDNLAEKHNILKVKTTGEVYMAVANIPVERPTAAIDAISFCLDALEGIRILSSSAGYPLRPRFGVNTGFVVAGTMHTSRLTFDLFGDAVNVAHRMMMHGIPGAVQISISTLRQLPRSIRMQVQPALLEPMSARSTEGLPIDQGSTPRTPSAFMTPRTPLSTARTDRAKQSNEVDDANLELCQDWIVHPRGSIVLKHHGAMESFLISRELSNVGAFVEGSNEVVPSGPGSITSSFIRPRSRQTASRLNSLYNRAPSSPSGTIQIDAKPSGVPSVVTQSQIIRGDPAPSIVSVDPRDAQTGTFSVLSDKPRFKKTNSRRSRNRTNASMVSSSSHPSNTTSSSDIERAFEEYQANATGDLLSTLRQSMQQRLISDESGESVGQMQSALAGLEVQEVQESKLSPAELANSGKHLVNQLTPLCMFRDPKHLAKFARSDTRRSIQRFRYLLVLLAVISAGLAVFQYLLYPGGAVPIFVLRLGVMEIVSLLCFLATFLKWNPPLRFRISGISWALTWEIIVFVEHGILMGMHPPTSLFHKNIAYNFLLVQVAFVMAAFVAPLIHADIQFSIIVGGLSIIVTWIMAHVPLNIALSYPRIIALTLICILMLFLTATYQRSTRLSFLQRMEINGKFKQMSAEDQQCIKMLESSLPPMILKKLKTNPAAVSQRISDVTIFFADFVKFTEFCSAVPSVFVVQLLDEIYARFDIICKSHSVTPIATIGDCYFAGSGIVTSDPAHTVNCVRAALDILQAMKDFNKEKGITLALRVGLHTGTVFSGVLGVTRFTFDVWGPAVTEAKKIEGASKANNLLISQDAKQQLIDQRVTEFIYRSGPVVNKSASFFVAHRRRNSTSPSHPRQARSETQAHTQQTHTTQSGHPSIIRAQSGDSTMSR